MRVRLARVLALVILAMALGAPASANVNGYHWDANWATGGVTGGWVEDECTGTSTRVVVYRNRDFKGDHTAMCVGTNNFCAVPLTSDSNPTGPCPGPFAQEWLNDNISSIDVVRISQGYDCVRFWTGSGSGGERIYTNDVAYVGDPVNDAFSSWGPMFDWMPGC